MKTSSVILPLTVLLFSFMVSCQPGRHEEMQRQLETLSLHNRQDSVLTNDSLAQALADWFDAHGKPNEQVLAHYLLGRTHADRGEAPAAIAAYHGAIDHADTTAQDCDYGQLARVYAQMADVFYAQNLIEDQLSCINKSIANARAAGDMVVELNEYAQKMTALNKMQQHDSVIQVFEDLYRRLGAMGYGHMAAQYCCMPMVAMIAKRDYVQARRLLSLYEKESGFFDEDGNIREGCEVYYYYKGLCYLGCQQYDTAHYYFMKELRDGKDFNNQNAAARGLAQLYKLTNKPDSSAKYALYSYDMNDSMYAQMATAEVEKTKGLYVYTRHQRLAAEEKARADHKSIMAVIYLTGCICLFTLLCSFAVVMRFKRHRERAVYQANLEILEKTQSDFLQLQEQEAESSRRIEEREKTIERQESIIASMRQKEGLLDGEIHEYENAICQLRQELKEMKSQNDDFKSQIAEGEKELEEARHNLSVDMRRRKRLQKKANDRLKSSPVYRELREMAESDAALSEVMWHKVHKTVIDIFPDFYYFVSSKEPALNKNEYRCCILLRLYIPPKHISSLLRVSPSYVTKMTGRIYHVFFGGSGTTKELMDRFSEIS